MIGALEIRPLRALDAPAFAAIRLRTFTEHPDSFGTSPEEWSAKPLAAIEAMLSSAEQGFLGAFAPELIGHVGLHRDLRIKRAHRAALVAMYVAPENRGSGIGARLLEATIAQARSEQLRCLHLTVMAHNTAAVALYKRFGFVRYAFVRDALRVGDRFLDEEYLELRLA